MEQLSFSEILESDRKRAEKAKLIAEKIRSAGGYKWVGLYDVKEKEITIISCAGRGEPAFTSFPKDKGLNGRAVMKKQTVIVNDTEKDEDYLLTFTNTKSEIIVPVYGANDQIAGTIDAEGEVKEAFTEKDAGFLENCAVAIQTLWTTTRTKQ
ncbi:MAG TPA: GAF domain-containing protein [Chitinophagaceae bacterium]|nr:GAF domain-containing protein [Chitinophagaceae bacterium]